MLKFSLGGLVELEPTMLTRHDNGSRMLPTRSIGDPSTGTDTNAVDNPPSSSEPDPSNSHVSNASTNILTSARLLSDPTPSSPTQLITTMNMNASDPPRAPTSLSFNPLLRVLVVDDDHLTRKLMNRMLSRLGCDVSTAENGQVALELITGDGRTLKSEDCEQVNLSPVTTTPREAHESPNPRYELIFLDNQMPVLSGLELVTKLREMGRSELVVGVTGNALLSDQEEYREAGVD